MSVGSNGSKEKRFWTAKEAADYLHLNVSTIYRYLDPAYRKKHNLDAISPPPPHRWFSAGRVLFPVEKFKAWVDAPDTQKQGQP